MGRVEATVVLAKTSKEQPKKSRFLDGGPSCQDSEVGGGGCTTLSQPPTLVSQKFLAFWHTPLIPLPVKRQRRQQQRPLNLTLKVPLVGVRLLRQHQQNQQPQVLLLLTKQGLTKWRT